MSHACSVSTRCPYGVARVCGEWQVLVPPRRAPKTVGSGGTAKAAEERNLPSGSAFGVLSLSRRTAILRGTAPFPRRTDADPPAGRR